jgi:hypothetical protein
MRICDLIEELKKGNATSDAVIDFGKGYTSDIGVSYDDAGTAYIYVMAGAKEYSK